MRNRLRNVAPNVEFRTHPSWIETVVVDGDGADMPLERRVEAAILESGRSTDFARPATFEPGRSIGELKGFLNDLGLSGGTLGFDLDFVPAADFTIIAKMLADHELQNGSPVLDRLRAFKSEAEIALLQSGIRFSEQGFRRLEANASAGMRQSDLIELYRDGVAEASDETGLQVSTTEFVSIGVRQRPVTEPAESGDPVKADMACSVEGYQADMSRNFVFGSASADQSRLHAIAEEVFERGLAALQPGCPLCRVHAAASAALAEHGMPSYRRGHFGHGVGQSVFCEQWPFIAADSDATIEPGMVLAYEIPLYVEGIASFNLEDQFLITRSGPESMNALPRRLGILA